jgi:hypothetical protein
MDDRMMMRGNVQSTHVWITSLIDMVESLYHEH